MTYGRRRRVQVALSQAQDTDSTKRGAAALLRDVAARVAVHEGDGGLGVIDHLLDAAVTLENDAAGVDGEEAAANTALEGSAGSRGQAG